MGFGLINPTMDKVLKTFKLDIAYHRADGLHLYDKDGNRYLDFIAQYGAVPFGYNPPEIVSAIREFLDSGIPTMVQPSIPLKAVELAERLLAAAPGNMAQVTFCQSGAEAVETGIKLASSATGKPKIVSASNSFHGKTMGALSATGRQVYQEPFFVPVPGFMTVPFDDLDALEEMFSNEGNNIAAFIVEPIQGEGGIIIPSEGYLKQAGELCRKYRILLIVDEIQTGLGRTGRLFACEEEGVEPDILLLAKALGGGMVPVGACLCTKEVWNQDFGKLHSSTFANNNLTCSVGLAVLDKLTQEDSAIVKNAAVKGKYII
ncbi:MAG TPA: aspartate aminotransferase family protein, partial [Desulfobacteria bacterium]|nr:aspartate aminotransferase family protein [Desulfobacteria bacterium]